MKRLGILVAVLAGVLAVAGCTGGGDTPAATPSATSGSATSPSTDDGAGGGATVPPPLCDPAPAPTDRPCSRQWTTEPVTVSHDPAVPPVPQLLRIRSAAHPDQGFDRIVFDFAGPLPGYTVRYVDQVRQDPSDLPAQVPGRRFLLVVFTPAQAHTDAGAPLVPATSSPFDHPMMRGYALVGDFEGYVSVAVGLDDVVGFRIGELPGRPGRVYLDVAA